MKKFTAEIATAIDTFKNNMSQWLIGSFIPSGLNITLTKVETKKRVLKVCGSASFHLCSNRSTFVDDDDLLHGRLLCTENIYTFTIAGILQFWLSISMIERQDKCLMWEGCLAERGDPTASQLRLGQFHEMGCKFYVEPFFFFFFSPPAGLT